MIDDVRLPVDIERGAMGGPEFRTTVVTMVGGRERRNQEWEVPLMSFNIGYGIRRRAEMEEVYAFFIARGGKARGFRFKNWLDFSATLTPVGEITGEPTKRQLIRVYEDVVNPQLRIVVYPIQSTLKVYVNQVLTTDYLLQANGVIEFPADPGPDVLASFEYDIPVRFDTDQLNTKLNTFKEGEQPSIQVVELRP
jgi:uncharacterized protein (TIGR02217 family)